MADPKKMEGVLTAAQFEILDAIWSTPDAAAGVAEIHAVLAAARDVARTTVLTQVRRLAERGWLARESIAGRDRYRVACTRAEAEGRIAGEFVDEYFGGSTTDLVRSLLGGRRVSKRELAELRKLLDEPGAGGAS